MDYRSIFMGQVPVYLNYKFKELYDWLNDNIIFFNFQFLCCLSSIEE